VASISRSGREAGYGAPVALALPRLRIRSGSAPPSLGLGPVVAAGTEWSDVNGRIATRTSKHAAGASVERVGVAHYALPDGTDLVDAWPSDGQPDEVVAAAFERSVVPLLLSHRGALYLHASAVVTGAGVVAICGRSETGKSTMAAALGARGYEVWADDAVVILPSPSPPVSVHVGSTLRLDPSSVALVGTPVVAGPSPQRGDVRRLAGVVILERVADAASPEMGRLSGGSVLAAVLEHALCFSLGPDDRAPLISSFLAVLTEVPVQRLRFTADVGRFASLVDDLQRHLGGLPPSGEREAGGP
jgi:hypothetical protein